MRCSRRTRLRRRTILAQRSATKGLSANSRGARLRPQTHIANPRLLAARPAEPRCNIASALGSQAMRGSHAARAKPCVNNE